MADLMSILQANAAPPQGWASVGQALAGLGGAGRQNAYDRGMAKAAQLDQLVQTARYSREKAMEAEDARKGRGGFAPAAIAAGIPEAQAGLLSSAFAAGYDPTKLSGYLGDTQERGFLEGAVGRALAGDFGGGNAYLMGVANGPVELASVQGQNLINNRLLEGGGGISTTEQGRAGIAADAARAAASYASANSSNASAARTRQAMSLDRADTMGGSGGRGGMKAPSGYRWKADGSLEAIPGGPADITGNAGDPTAKATEGERSAAGFLQRMVQSEAELEGLRAGGYDAANLRDFYTAGEGTLLNRFASDKGQVNRQQQEDWVRAKLRKESGAVIGDEEMDREIKTYFPQPGDSAAVLQSKGRSRDRAITQMRITAGRAASLGDRPPASLSSAFGGTAPMRADAGVRPTTGQAPAVGTTRGGYRYKGGDPADRSSWERL